MTENDLDEDEPMHIAMAMAELYDAQPAPSTALEWTRALVDRTGPARYAILVRAPGDPERRSRENRHAALGRAAAGSEWKEMRKATAETWAERFAAVLADGRPRTLNALTVELADATADVAGDNAEAALWLLKERGQVEHTVEVPVLWRAIGEAAK